MLTDEAGERLRHLILDTIMGQLRTLIAQEEPKIGDMVRVEVESFIREEAQLDWVKQHELRVIADEDIAQALSDLAHELRSRDERRARHAMDALRDRFVVIDEDKERDNDDI